MRWRLNWRIDWRIDWRGVEVDGSVVPGFGPGGVGTLVLDIQNGLHVVHEWMTDIVPHKSGSEQRISRNDVARQSFAGAAILLGDMPRLMRAKMAGLAALGSQFLLALPREELLLRATSSGTTVYVGAAALALTDWVLAGQRAVVVRENAAGGLESIDVVIQSKGSDSIVLDVDPGDLGRVGGRIMPTCAVYLEPQQDFERLQVDAEIWNLRARAAVLDFAPTRASLALGPITDSAALDGVVIYARESGLIGNTRSFAMFSGGPPSGLLLDLGGTVQFFYDADTTTLDEMAAVLAASSFVVMGGTWTGSATIAAGDSFIDTMLDGAEASGAVGSGAALVEYADLPVWSMPLGIDDSITDSVQAMTRILDHGGIPYSLPMADRSDWGRTIHLRKKTRAVWQWWKLFTWTVKGRQKSWWLPTWRDDLPFLEKDAGTITIDSDSSGFATWYPSQRQHIQIVERNGTVTRAEITEAVNNGDGTTTLTIGTTLGTSDVLMVSWLELCRFESDTYDTEHGAHGFGLSVIARVVQE